MPHASGGLLSRRRIVLILVGFVALNLAWRIVRAGLNFALWGDEAMLAINFQTRGMEDLLRPLVWAQLAPPGYLWLIDLMTRTLGYHEWSLRIWSMLAGAGAMLGFAAMAWRHLRPREAVLATAALAVSYYPLRHSVEVKPYAIDFFASVILFWIALELRRALVRGRASIPHWIAWTAAAALFVWFSFPVIMAAAATGLWLAWLELRPPGAARFGLSRGALTSVAAGVLVLASFGAMYWIYRDVRQEELGKYHEMTYWDGAFPPLDRPWMIPFWLIEVHAGRMSAYPIGDRNFASTGSLIVMIAGAVALWRAGGGRRRLLALALLPLGFGLVAATVGAYPYGTTVRTMLYAAPGMLMLLGIGAAGLLRLVPPARRGAVFGGIMLVLLIIGLAGAARDIIRPYKIRDDRVARAAVVDWAASATEQDLWIFPIADRWPIPGGGGEWYLGTASLGPVLQYYAQWHSPATIWYAPPPELVAEAHGRFRRIRVITSNSKYDPPLGETLDPYLEALVPLLGQGRQERYPLKIDGELVTVEWE